MAYPVMRNLPLRWVLECVEDDFQSLKKIRKTFFLRHPLEAWLVVSFAIRRKVFKEKKTAKEKDEEVVSILQKLHRQRYVEKEEGRPYYKLSDKGREAKRSVLKRPRP